MKRLLLVAVACTVCVTAFAEDANHSLHSSSDHPEPWWVSLVTAAVTAVIGLFSRWFEKRFLQKRITDALVKEITSRDKSVSREDISHLVAKAFSKEQLNGTHL